jgi:DnaA family protein
MTRRVRRINAGGQLALPVTLADYATFENFHPAGNEAALAALMSDRAVPMWLFGATGTGKSHLLQALCQRTPRSVYLTGAMLLELPPAALEGFERYALVCVDEIHRLIGDRQREVALFHLYNRLAEAGGALVVAAPLPPPGLDFVLPDLASRLRAALTLELHPLDDEGRIQALKLRARCRGFELPGATGRYLLSHYRRDMASLCALLDRLDHASLAAQRRLTVPFVKSIL